VVGRNKKQDKELESNEEGDYFREECLTMASLKRNVGVSYAKKWRRASQT